MQRANILLCTAALLSALAASPLPAAAAALSWTAATTPVDGNIAGAAGATIGWGYAITNTDPSHWLMLTSVSADAVQNATVQALFDLPIVAPGATVAVDFDGLQGLFALTWDTTAPVGFVNVGSFVLTGEWWDADPLTSGSFVTTAADSQLDYSATVVDNTPTGVPEPGSWPLALLALGTLGLATRRAAAAPATARTAGQGGVRTRNSA